MKASEQHDLLPVLYSYHNSGGTKLTKFIRKINCNIEPEALGKL